MIGVAKSTFDHKRFLASCSTRPGVYQMYDKHDKILYVGKARNLKNRLSSYFQKSVDSAKTKVLVSHIHYIETTITQSENEALLLENNLIKSLRPRYNIVFRDDKSYPYLIISDHPDYPRLSFYRGRTKTIKGQCFGPYANAGSARESLNLLQKIFHLRSCDESFFTNRSRPCLQYQIKRCTAPCVKHISKAAYQQDVRHAVMFLQGKNQQVIAELVHKMEQASESQQYEQAAILRDQIALLRRIQEQQYVMTHHGHDVDVVGYAMEHGVICVSLLLIRAGEVIGNKAYYPKAPTEFTQQEVIAEFISQHYLNQNVTQKLPKEIILPCDIDDKAWLAEGLSAAAGCKVQLLVRVQQTKQQWLAMASHNAKQSLYRYITDKTNTLQRLEDLTEALGLSALPQRIECFDISHTMGEATVASCVVFNQEGPLKTDYRRFNIKDIQAGDDYAAMRQALTRRYRKVKEKEGKLPDLLIIDGGKGQLSQAEQVLRDLQVTDIQLLGVAKGPSRKAGLEQLFIESKGKPIQLAADSPGLHLIQFIRDEAHRFAITGHRQRRSKKRSHSALEDIPGVGAKRRRELLRQFGGLQELKRAGMDEIAKVPGISKSLAEKIFLALH